MLARRRNPVIQAMRAKIAGTSGPKALAMARRRYVNMSSPLYRHVADHAQNAERLRRESLRNTARNAQLSHSATVS